MIHIVTGQVDMCHKLGVASTFNMVMLSTFWTAIHPLFNITGHSLDPSNIVIVGYSDCNG
jgi:hypothetical protein